MRSANSILTWLCSAFSNPHLFLFPSILLLLSHPVVPITFCGSFQKYVWNGALFASSQKSKEMEKVQLHCSFLVVNAWLWFYGLTSSFLGKRKEKQKCQKMSMCHPSIIKVQSAVSFWLLQSSFSSFFFLAELTLLVSCLLLVQICFYILISLWLLSSCAPCTGYYVLSTASQPKEKKNTMGQQWASK